MTNERKCKLVKIKAADKLSEPAAPVSCDIAERR